MMTSVQELLEQTLNELLKEERSRFQWHLKNHGIQASELESANVFQTVDKMVDRFKPEGAVDITVTILKKMQKNHQAELLENKVSRVNSDKFKLK